jgi:aspartate aminotransferase-like enzyme
MTHPLWSAVLDVPPFPSVRFGASADRIGRLLKTSTDVLLIQAEAVIALEAVALSLARPGVNALNVVTSPYGFYFGQWLRRGGAHTQDVVSEPAQPITVEAFAAALSSSPKTDIVAVVHGEAASGILNPLPEIVRLAKAHGALVVVDAVASVGGHQLHVDELGIDIAVVGPQKALGGPAGVSAITVSSRAWEFVGTPAGPKLSVLSLLDLKEQWLDRGRGALPGMPSALEFWALEAALDRIEEEGIEFVIARHAKAASASRAGLRALGIEPWIKDDAFASALVTSAPVPDDVQIEDLLAITASLGVAVSRGLGDAGDRFVRLNHTGTNTSFTAVLANVMAYGTALSRLGHPVVSGPVAEVIAAAYVAQTSSSRDKKLP